jgi:hypothetical protein
MMCADSSMYGQLTTKNTFLDLPCTIGFDDEALTVSGSSVRRSSSSPPSLACSSTYYLKKGQSPFILDDDAASTTTDDVSANSGTDDRSSSCSEHQDLAEVTQTLPVQERSCTGRERSASQVNPPTQEQPVQSSPVWLGQNVVARVIPADPASMKHPWIKQPEVASEAQPVAQELAGPQTASMAVTLGKQSPFVWSDQEVPEIPLAAPAPERLRARRRQVSSRNKIEEQEFVVPKPASSAIDEIGQPTFTQTGPLMVCYFHNRHLHSPDSYAPCGKGDMCKFCHEMHPLIKRRNCKATAFCNCRL